MKKEGIKQSENPFCRWSNGNRLRETCYFFRFNWGEFRLDINMKLQSGSRSISPSRPHKDSVWGEIRERPSRNLTRRNLKPLATDFKVLSWYIPRIFPSLTLSSPLNFLSFSFPFRQFPSSPPPHFLILTFLLFFSFSHKNAALAVQQKYQYRSASYAVWLLFSFFFFLPFEIFKSKKKNFCESQIDINKLIRIMWNKSTRSLLI